MYTRTHFRTGTHAHRHGCFIFAFSRPPAKGREAAGGGTFPVSESW